MLSDTTIPASLASEGLKSNNASYIGAWTPNSGLKEHLSAPLRRLPIKLNGLLTLMRALILVVEQIASV